MYGIQIPGTIVDSKWLTRNMLITCRQSDIGHCTEIYFQLIQEVRSYDVLQHEVISSALPKKSQASLSFFDLLKQSDRDIIIKNEREAIRLEIELQRYRTTMRSLSKDDED